MYRKTQTALALASLATLWCFAGTAEDANAGAITPSGEIPIDNAIVLLNAPNANYITTYTGGGAVNIDNPATASIADIESSTLTSMTLTLSTHTVNDVLTATVRPAASRSLPTTRRLACCRSAAPIRWPIT